MKHLSIRWRLSLWYAAALAVILIGFCLTLLLLIRHQLLARTDAALREELQELRLEVQLAKSEEELQEHLLARFFHHDIYDFVVSDERATVLFASSGLTNDQAASLVPKSMNDTWQFDSRILVKDQDYRVASTSVDGLRGYVAVQAMTSLQPLYDELRELQILMLVLLPLSILVALCVGHFLAARALAPVEQIVRVAEAITITDLDRRIEVLNPHDELGHLAMTLNSLIARLERAVDEIQRFTADASHELRTPLAILRSEAESALRRPRTSEEYEQTLTVVVEEAVRLGSLADQLLSLSRHDAGITEIRHDPIFVDALLQDVVDKLQPSAETRGIALTSSHRESCELRGDDIRLSQVFFNVVDNAIKYTTSGGVVDITCHILERCAVIAVRDTGIGIPPEHLVRVFDRFYRVDSSRHSLTGGAGLGLAICRTAVLAHSGEIHIQSEVGVGTTVTIRLPVVSSQKSNEIRPTNFTDTESVGTRSTVFCEVIRPGKFN
ncbi:HAMP domain-containing protein [bacterium]|nr:HAMP domain-containing protein [bacterium]